MQEDLEELEDLAALVVLEAQGNSEQELSLEAQADLHLVKLEHSVEEVPEDSSVQVVLVVDLEEQVAPAVQWMTLITSQLT